MTTFPNVLLYAPHGSVRLLDAVQATFGSISDWRFNRLMEKRDAILRAKCHPLDEPVEPRVSMAGRKLQRRVASTATDWREEAVA